MTPPVSPDERDKSGKDIAEMKSVSENYGFFARPTWNAHRDRFR
jgi:hypothetical protein